MWSSGAFIHMQWWWDISWHILLYSFHKSLCSGRHVRTHSEENPHKCRHCEKSFTVKSHLKVHIISHITENNYQCTYCHKPFSNNINIKYHNLIAHTGEKTYICSLCDKYFSQNSDLRSHMNAHTRDKTYLCKNCDISIFEEFSFEVPFI